METTNKIIVDDGTEEVELACGLCGEYIYEDDQTECEMCGAFFHPAMSNVVMTYDKFEKEFLADFDSSEMRC